MSKNRGVVYVKPGLVEVQDIADPKFEDPHGRKINHAVILKIVSTNICGSDQHMVRGRTTAPAGLVLGHEITGEVIEKGVTSSSSMWATSSRCHSTSRVGAAVHAARGILASASR
jgi:threonine dehydrogenase-like Zn-dependent dehydrogenase